MTCTGQRPEYTWRAGGFASLLLLLHGAAAFGETPDHSGHGSHRMVVSPSGMVMHENHSDLPRDCSEISGDHEFTITAGRAFARDVPGMVFGMSQHEVRVPGCSRVRINFVNEDHVRHQWMVHGLPRYLYPAGMFHLEAAGGHRVSGTFIVPGEDRTYLVHCDMAQHMEKGMRGQLVVGGGSGDLWGVPGISSEFRRSSYLPYYALPLALLVFVLALCGSLWILAKSQAAARQGALFPSIRKYETLNRNQSDNHY